MTRFVSTLGFSGHRVTRPIIAHGLTAGDTVELLAPTQPHAEAQERTEGAIRDIEEMLSGVVREVDITEHRLETGSFPDVTDEVSELLMAGEPPVVCLGAGASDITYPVFAATLAHSAHVRDVMLFSDIENAGVEQPIPNLMATIPGRTQDVFEALANRMDEGPVMVSTLAEAADRSLATASRHVDALADEGLVQKERSEQAKQVSLTPTGRLFARNQLA